MSLKKEPGSDFSEPGINLATTYSHRTYRPTTIGAAAFHFRVRNGTGWFHRAVVTRGQSRMIGTGTLAASLGNFCPLSDIHTEKHFLTEQFTRNHFTATRITRFQRNQAKRMISTGKLNILLHLHFQPINVVVFHDPLGKTHLGKSLALRCFQRLSRPHLATQPCP